MCPTSFVSAPHIHWTVHENENQLHDVESNFRPETFSFGITKYTEWVFFCRGNGTKYLLQIYIIRLWAMNFWTENVGTLTTTKNDHIWNNIYRKNNWTFHICTYIHFVDTGRSNTVFYLRNCNIIECPSEFVVPHAHTTCPSLEHSTTTEHPRHYLWACSHIKFGFADTPSAYRRIYYSHVWSIQRSNHVCGDCLPAKVSVLFILQANDISISICIRTWQ